MISASLRSKLALDTKSESDDSLLRCSSVFSGSSTSKISGEKNTLNKLLFCTSGNIIANTDIFPNEMAICAVGSAFKTEITKIA